MAKYRPKSYIIYFYGQEHKALISCYPQSRWELISKSDKSVGLTNKHTTIYMTAEDFERHWIKVEKKGKIEK